MCFRVSFPGVAVDDFYRHPQPVFCQIKGVRLWFFGVLRCHRLYLTAIK
nr:MAG TPA: hypothetical protein [Caudoviricetes sp.]